jgi:hypothetical protein
LDSGGLFCPKVLHEERLAIADNALFYSRVAQQERLQVNLSIALAASL